MIAAKVASFLYRGIEFLSMNIGASHKVTMTIDYRRRWQNFLPKEAASKGGLWIHGASVGELEDLAAFFGNKSLLEESGYDYSRLIITSSSPSAEEFLLKVKEKYNPLYAGPLPPDVLPRVEDFFDHLKPELLILSQSDLWPVLLSVAKKKLRRGAIWLPHKSTSASWGKNLFLGPLVKKVGLRREDSKNPLPQSPAEFVGSPRIDRILERIKNTHGKEHPLKDQLAKSQGKIRILIGSAWKEDAEVACAALESIRKEDRSKFEIFAIPHDTKNTAELASISSYLGKNITAKEGILLESYQEFDMAFIGGGFRTGLHNIIEALAWGIPTVCGADLRKQPEAPYFESQGSLKTVKNQEEMRKLLVAMMENSFIAKEWKEKAKDAAKLLKAQSGASERLAKLISELR